jgi:hypothetical protein
MDKVLAAKLATDLAVGETRSTAELFLAHGGQPPRVIWGPGPDDIDLPPLTFLLRYWTGLPRAAGVQFPHWRTVDPIDMRKALGHVAVIEVLDGGADFSYRVYGTRIAERYGSDLTGRRTSETDGGSYAAAFLVAVYRAALKRREPVFSVHFPSPRSSTAQWSRIVLPLVGDGDGIERFLAGIIAGPWRPPSAT